MNMLFNGCRKIEVKIKSFLKRRIISFIDADFTHYSLIADFLKTNREPENYLVFLLKKFLNAANSQKMIYSNTIALIFGKIIGFDSHILFPHHYYWGSSVTVHPRFRKLGVAGNLIGIGEKIASEIKINKIRTAVMFWNIPIFKKLGFSEIRPWYILGYKMGKAKVAASKFTGVREAVDSDLERLEQFLFQSKYFISSNEMYAEDLIWYPLDPVRSKTSEMSADLLEVNRTSNGVDQLWLSDLIKEGKILLSEDGSGIRGLAIINKQSLINPFPDNSFSIVEIGYLDGDYARILDFVQANYHPDFLRIYSADGIPLKFLPNEIKNGYFVKFNSLFGGLNSLNPSEGKLYFTSVMLMEKMIKN